MTKIHNVIGACLTVVLTGSLCMLLICGIAFPVSSGSSLLWIINVIILSLMVTTACAIAILHTKSLREGDKRLPNAIPADHINLPPNPYKQYKAAMEEETCCICLSQLGDGTSVVLMECCSNPIHTSCIQNYVLSQRRSSASSVKCVLCRARIE